jgi:hypothetical protein
MRYVQPVAMKKSAKAAFSGGNFWGCPSHIHIWSKKESDRAASPFFIKIEKRSRGPSTVVIDINHEINFLFARDCRESNH